MRTQVIHPGCSKQDLSSGFCSTLIRNGLTHLCICMQDIYVNTIDEAAKAILGVLKEKANTTSTVGSRDNVFYFDGWGGLGACAVLRAIAQRLSTTSADGKRALAEQEFDQVIHIDCSMWQSRRALQRAVAEQLKLPDKVMELFDREDEEDDFRGVAQGSRAELQWKQRGDRSGQLLWLPSIRIFNQQGAVDIPREIPAQTLDES